MKVLPKTRATTVIAHEDGSIAEVTDMLCAVAAAAVAHVRAEPTLSEAHRVAQRRRRRRRG